METLIINKPPVNLALHRIRFQRPGELGRTIFLSGAAIGFLAGMVLEATNPQFFFSQIFLSDEGTELGAIAFLSIGFSMAGALSFLLLYSFPKHAIPPTAEHSVRPKNNNKNNDKIAYEI